MDDGHAALQSKRSAHIPRFAASAREESRLDDYPLGEPDYSMPVIEQTSLIASPTKAGAHKQKVAARVKTDAGTPNELRANTKGTALERVLANRKNTHEYVPVFKKEAKP